MIATGGCGFLGVLLLPLVCEMFGILQLKFGLLLCLHHKIIIQPVVDLFEIDLREVDLRRLLDQLLYGAHLAGDGSVIVE